MADEGYSAEWREMVKKLPQLPPLTRERLAEIKANAEPVTDDNGSFKFAKKSAAHG